MAAIAVFILTLVFARVTRRAVRRYGTKLDFVAPAAVDAVARIASYVVVAIGLAAGLSILGIQLIPLLGGLGLLIVIAALALRSFLENFAAGMTLHIERPIELGDEALISGVEGRIEGINARSVLVRSNDGRRSFIPNRNVLQQEIVNYTAEGRRRSEIDVGLAYDSDLERASSLMTEAVATAPGVLDDPPPEVLIHEFADSTINARVRFWHEPAIRSMWMTRHEVAVAVKRTLDASGIEIAFPQRVLWHAGSAVDDAEPA